VERWLSVLLELMGAVLALIVAILVIVAADAGDNPPYQPD
jgi:hypothetical protein